MRYQAKPVTGADIGAALWLLKACADGVSDSELEARFSSVDRGWEVMEHLAESGIAAVIFVSSPRHKSIMVHKLVESREELDEHIEFLRECQGPFERRIKGLIEAFEAGGVRELQKGLKR